MFNSRLPYIDRSELSVLLFNELVSELDYWGVPLDKNDVKEDLRWKAKKVYRWVRLGREDLMKEYELLSCKNAWVPVQPTVQDLIRVTYSVGTNMDPDSREFTGAAASSVDAAGAAAATGAAGVIALPCTRITPPKTCPSGPIFPSSRCTSQPPVGD